MRQTSTESERNDIRKTCEAVVDHDTKPATSSKTEKRKNSIFQNPFGQNEKNERQTDLEIGLGKSKMHGLEENNPLRREESLLRRKWPNDKTQVDLSEMVDSLIFSAYGNIVHAYTDGILSGKCKDSAPVASTEITGEAKPTHKDSAPPPASTESKDDISLVIDADSNNATSKESATGDHGITNSVALKRRNSTGDHGITKESATGDHGITNAVTPKHAHSESDILSKPKGSGIPNDIINLWRISSSGNTVLHIIALFGKFWLVKVITQKVPDLLAKENDNGDTPLHVAARATNFYTLKLLWKALLCTLPYSAKPEEALHKILAKNKQGNTFFYEALLNGRKNAMEILDYIPIEDGFKELVLRAALFWTNKEEKSVFHLAIEKGYEDIVDNALASLTCSNHLELDELIKKHQDFTKMMPKPPLPEQDQERGMKVDDSSMDNMPTSMWLKMIDKEDLLELTLSMADWKIMNAFEKPSSRNGEHQGLNQDSNPHKSSENHKQSTHLLPYGSHYVPPGQSPLTIAILNRKEGILKKILTKKKEWIRLKDDKGMTALHYAAYIGYLTGVNYLLENGISCNLKRHNSITDSGKCLSYNMVRDKHQGFCAIHFASAGGHAEVVKKLLRHSTNANEIVDNDGRNIAHIAAQMGHYNVIKYILRKRRLVEMINAQDRNGNTPLHLATLYCHPKIVHALTWNKTADVTLGNKENQTAFDVYTQFQQENPPLRLRLILIALVSCGAKKYADHRRSHSIVVPPHLQSAENVQKKESPNKDPYKDRINTLMVVSTLIITVTFAAGFTLPGGINNGTGGSGEGMALMLNHVWFKSFIFFITISMYGAVSSTILLTWAHLGDITLTRFALKVAMPLLGITLATLSVAFMVGVHLVISDLSWLATTFMALSIMCIFILSWLYILLWFFSTWSNRILLSNRVFRYIFYIPFRCLVWLLEQGEQPEE